MTRALQDALTGPLLAALLFLGSVVAARSLTATFWLVPPVRALVKFAPTLFLLLFLLAQWRFFRRAAGEERAFLNEAILFAAITTVSVLALGEMFAFLGGRLWDPAEIWHWVALLAGVELNAKLALIPILNVSLVSKEILTGNYPWGLIGLIFGSSSLYAAAALFVAVRAFQRESVLFRT